MSEAVDGDEGQVDLALVHQRNVLFSKVLLPAVDVLGAARVEALGGVEAEGA